MKRVAATLALSLVVLGCSEPVQRIDVDPDELLAGEPVELLTGVQPGKGDGCHWGSVEGQLIVHSEYGTALIKDNPPFIDIPPWTTVVAWRPGFHARRVGSEVVVLDPDGHVVARTGGRYVIQGGIVDQHVTGWPGIPTVAWWACDSVRAVP
jgi:hypothetical protein